ncbi:MAG: PolC-type DNA polymerase III N-terminal domain-containing protein [Macrococcoides caseolyticum]
MTINNNEKFKVLLKQLQIEDLFTIPDLDEAELTKIDVYKHDRRWHMYFKFHTHLPYELFALLKSKIKEHFEHIATVTFEIEVLDALDTEKLCAYIPYAIDQTNMSPSLKHQLNSKPFTFSGDILKFRVTNEIEKVHFEKNCNDTLLKAFKDVGFNVSRCIFEVSDNAEQEELASLEAYIQEEEENHSKILREKMIEREKQRKEDDGPEVTRCQIGKPIQIENVKRIESIIEEEYKVALEGVVFDIDIMRWRAQARWHRHPGGFRATVHSGQ